MWLRCQPVNLWGEGGYSFSPQIPIKPKTIYFFPKKGWTNNFLRESLSTSVICIAIGHTCWQINVQHGCWNKYSLTLSIFVLNRTPWCLQISLRFEYTHLVPFLSQVLADLFQYSLSQTVTNQQKNLLPGVTSVFSTNVSVSVCMYIWWPLETVWLPIWAEVIHLTCMCISKFSRKAFQVEIMPVPFLVHF